MRSCAAFVKKEFLESVRTGKLLILAILFGLFGVMNPAIAKLTPWMVEQMADSLADMGLIAVHVEVNALTSWAQFYKNIPLAMVVFLLMFSSIFTVEYQRGTLVNMLTKGLDRWKVVLAKTDCMIAFWTVGYWLCYGITYGYTAYFWDNSMVFDPTFAAFCVYLLGIWLISLILMASAFGTANTMVLLATGVVFGMTYVFAYLLQLIPELSKLSGYLPVQLLTSDQVLVGSRTSEEYMGAIAVTVVWSIGNVAAAIAGFNQKAL